MPEDSQGKDMTRREFGAKVLKGLAGAYLATNIPSQVELKERNIDKVGFEEIEDGSIVKNLQIHNQLGVPDIYFYYFLAHDHIGVRKHGEDDACIGFQAGQEIKRHVGEITDPTIYKVTKAFEEDLRIGVYPGLDGNLKNIRGRSDLPSKDLYAIPVIVGPCNYYPAEGESPQELNPETGRHYGNGYLVGDLEKKDGGYSFYGIGYVCDARALKEDIQTSV